MKKLIEIIFRDKVVSPRLASGIYYSSYLVFFSILEKITNIQFISKYIILITIINLPLGYFIFNHYAKTYDKNNNDNILFFFIGIINGIIFFCLNI
jgi:positive regulator of sigma E activity